LTLVGVLLAAAWMLPASRPAEVLAQDPDGSTDGGSDFTRTLNVSGTGEAFAKPDVAVVSLGVTTEAEDAGEALTENNTRMAAVIEALTDAGIDTDDIQTQTIRLSPRYERPEPRPGATRSDPVLVGFVATNVIEVRVRDLDNLGEVLDDVIQAGGNQIQGIRFEISDQSELYVQARQAAWENALAKAEQLAELAGVELGAVLTINETSYTPVRYAERAVAYAADAAGVPVEAGTESVQISLQVTWSLQEIAE
jgi:hypothetical protein